MKIDEPETPWASPPRELFDDDGALSASAAALPHAHLRLAEALGAGQHAHLQEAAARLAQGAAAAEQGAGQHAHLPEATNAVEGTVAEPPQSGETSLGASAPASVVRQSSTDVGRRRG